MTPDTPEPVPSYERFTITYPAVAVDTNVDSEAGTAWVRVALFGDTVDALAPRLTKGAEIYCEGRLTLRPWTDADGKARAGLSLTASLVQPMGQIGRRKPKAVTEDTTPP